MSITNHFQILGVHEGSTIVTIEFNVLKRFIVKPRIILNVGGSVIKTILQIYVLRGATHIPHRSGQAKKVDELGIEPKAFRKPASMRSERSTN